MCFGTCKMWLIKILRLCVERNFRKRTDRKNVTGTNLKWSIVMPDFRIVKSGH